MPHLDAARRLQPVPARRAGVTVAHLRGLDGAVGGEVAAGDEVEDVVAGRVGSGDPRGAVDDAGVDEVADAGRVARCRARRDRCSPWRASGGRRSPPPRTPRRAAGSTWAPSRFSSTSRSPGRPIASGSRVPSGWTRVTTTFFRVSAAVHARPSSRGKASLRWSTRVSMVGVSGVSSTWAAGTPEASTASGTGTRMASTLAAYPQFAAAHVGVLAVVGGREELLRLRAAHRARHRLDDDVVEAEPVEDPDVGVTVQLVALVEPGLVDVEGVAVLHDELAPAQQAGAGPGLVAVLGLDLVDRQRAGPCTRRRGPSPRA